MRREGKEGKLFKIKKKASERTMSKIVLPVMVTTAPGGYWVLELRLLLIKMCYKCKTHLMTSRPSRTGSFSSVCIAKATFVF